MVKQLLALILALTALVLQPTAVEAVAPTIYCSQGTISSASSKTLQSVPAVVVAAKGANTIVRVLKMVVKVVPESSSFWSQAATLSVRYNTGTAGIQTLLSGPSDLTTAAYASNSPSATTTVDIRNKAVVLVATNDTIGGAGTGAVITYRVVYYVATSNH